MDENNIHELNENLEKLAPHLSKLKKEEPFSLPGDYFDDLASRIQQKCADADELREIAPLLSEIPKYNPFAVPAGYFDELPLRIQEKCIEARKPSWIERITWMLRPAFAIPAAVVVIALVLTFALMNGNDNGKIIEPLPVAEVHYDNNSAEAITAQALDIDDPALMEALWDNSENEITEEDFYINANEEEIIKYLVENDADVSSIVKEL